MRGLVFALALVALPAHAQVVSAPPAAVGPVVDQAARDAAAAAQAKADAAQAAIPIPASTIPGMEMVGGAAGSANTFRRGDAVQPRISRTIKQAVTGSNGTATVSWPAMPSVPALTLTEYVAANDTVAPSCYPVTGTVTTTGATIKCFVDQSILGLGLLPRKAAGAGVTFDVLALPAS